MLCYLSVQKVFKYARYIFVLAEYNNTPLVKLTRTKAGDCTAQSEFPAADALWDEQDQYHQNESDVHIHKGEDAVRLEETVPSCERTGLIKIKTHVLSFFFFRSKQSDYFSTQSDRFSPFPLIIIVIPCLSTIHSRYGIMQVVSFVWPMYPNFIIIHGW